MYPPSVDALAESLLETGLPKPLCVDIARKAILDGETETALEQAYIYKQNMLGSVVNASGVLLHTNLGRAPYAVTQPASYTNLELNMKTGQRGSRQDHIGGLFAQLTGAEAGMVVNNCAAAVTLIVAALAEKDGGVVVSRGELVEIGGGFRVPEVIASTGAKLIEIGTTNRTHLKDYEKAVKKSNPKICLKVHQSNYSIKGFTEAVSLRELKNLPIPLVVDVGSGLLDARCLWLESPPAWLVDEPAVKQTLESGADLVAFSGDKLLGGPQAGIIVGAAELVEKCASHPLARAFRVGGTIITALRELALQYMNRQKVPFWEMATLTQKELEERADKILLELGSSHNLKTTSCFSLPGGGTLPDVQIPSFGIAIDGDVAEKLRSASIIARVEEGATILDLRTVFPEQDQLLVKALSSL